MLLTELWYKEIDGVSNNGSPDIVLISLFIIIIIAILVFVHSHKES